MRPILLCIILLSISCTKSEHDTVCPFCDSNVIEKQVVYESPHFWVLADYAPLTFGHLLIVPKTHVERLDQLDSDLGNELLSLQKKVAAAFKEVLYIKDYFILEKNGLAAGQSVGHVHFHLVPMKSEGGQKIAQIKMLFRIFFGSRPDSPEELEKVVTLYRDYFQEKV